MRYRLDIYGGKHLCDVRCFNAADGLTACTVARQILAAAQPTSVADLLVSDGTGQHVFYTQVRADAPPSR